LFEDSIWKPYITKQFIQNVMDEVNETLPDEVLNMMFDQAEQSQNRIIFIFNVFSTVSIKS
jgi:hypothetical protein